VLRNETGNALDVRKVAINDLTPEAASIAHLTGTASYHFTDSEISSIKSYVQAGGILLIDSTGGQPAFANSIRADLLPRSFPDAHLAPIPKDHPVIANLTLRLRPYAIDQLGRGVPPIEMAQVGRGYVLFTPLDLNSGLLNTNTWGIVGYAPQSCEQFARNLVSWAVSTRPAD
jgi:hypothetical protein